MAMTPARGTATVAQAALGGQHRARRSRRLPHGPLLHAIMRPLTKRDWQDQQKVPQTGGAMFVVNHISNVDPLAVGQFLAFSGRWPRFLAKSSVFKVPVVGRYCVHADRSRSSASLQRRPTRWLRQSQAVEDGQAVTIYPEGTITRDPELWPMVGQDRRGTDRLQTGCPVIPIGQWGAQDVMYGNQRSVPATPAPQDVAADSR